MMATVGSLFARALRDGLFQDRRGHMPVGIDPETGKELHWARRQHSDILGVCIHHTGGKNTEDPIATANYHTSPGNHIRSSGKPCPGLCYTFAIPSEPQIPWLCNDVLDITWSQGKSDRAGYPGDENRHLIGIVVMGGFSTKHWPSYYSGPSKHQMEQLARLCEFLSNVYRFDNRGLFGHYHFGKAACPGDVLQEWIEGYRKVHTGEELSATEAWQAALSKWNPQAYPSDKIDGKWGPKSQTALVAFQRKSGLRVTGSRDPFTELMLIREVKK
jgi:hypothetical protein